MKNALTPTFSPRTGSGSNAIEIVARTGRAYVPFLRRTLPKVIGQISAPEWLSFVLVGDQTMSRLHAQFLNIAGPTDVLTFELDHGMRGNVTSGEIIVCVPEARRQSKQHGTRIEHELLLYCLHGILHLIGYDDLDEASHRRMHAAEDRILTAIGIGPVFRPPRSATNNTSKRDPSLRKSKPTPKKYSKR